MFVCGTSLGLSQHLPPVWSYVEGDQCWGSVNQIPLRQRHAPPPFNSITSLPFPLMFSGKAPAVFLVFIEQEVQWTRRAGSVFRHGGSRARLGPRAHCSLSGNCYFCYCCLILSDNVSFPNRGRCVCSSVCIFVCSPLPRPEMSVVHCGPKPRRGRGNHRPPISTQIVCQPRSHCDKDCFSSESCTEPHEDKQGLMSSLVHCRLTAHLPMT